MNAMHHKNCGGELYVKQWTDYGEDYGKLPDYYCRLCGDFITGDAQIQESVEEFFYKPNKTKRKK